MSTLFTLSLGPLSRSPGAIALIRWGCLGHGSAEPPRGSALCSFSGFFAALLHPPQDGLRVNQQQSGAVPY